MFINENLVTLNEKYNPKGLTFKKEGNIIRIYENPAFRLNELSTVQSYLKMNFGLKFTKKNMWHLDSIGILKLGYKRIKVKPDKTTPELYEEFNRFLDIIEEERLKTSMKEFFSENKSFFVAPAAVSKHHAYVGGLLEHTVQTVTLVQVVFDNLDKDLMKIDKDVLIAGALLHDIGKINCYNIEGDNIAITKTYLEQDHIVNGIKLITEKIESEKINEIIHIISSHHNLKDWGSPIEPKTNEAWIIHFIENLSSKLLG